MLVLLADDERPVLSFLERGLRAEGFNCATTAALHEVVPLAQQLQPDVIVLDRMFADEDSTALLALLKQRAPNSAVLLLSALSEVEERVKGLRLGADDYLAKPFDFEELLARIEVLARRAQAQPQADDAQQWCDVTLDKSQRQARVNDMPLRLTKLEFELLSYLLSVAGKVVSREQILSRVWNTHKDPLTNIVDVYISRLRSKLTAAQSQVQIVTLRGSGYRLCAVD
ncbi:hypothetical protein IDAT_09155 [Pseudidiomarina atlantica]|uniref:Transcriptional regulator n=1 Tax=Pseudidiomarina atlantica TaxID=1517416 RepID=A0A094L1G7_9GAMM|nr:response regulator transcription factor [Pseudidiomarina atlantica]KFZ28468.1 hypothetical protein IDAT_09155 [Pseudidiomarina atlantica]